MAAMAVLTAQIDNVDITDTEPDDGSILKQGMGILRTRITLLGGGQHAIFNVRVGRNDEYYLVRKRFSEFAVLHDFLKSRFGPHLPFDLPTKTMVRHFSADKLEDRKNALNAYLKEVCKRQEYISCPEVARFFEPQTGAAAAGQYAPRAAAGVPGTFGASETLQHSTYDGNSAVRQAGAFGAPPAATSPPVLVSQAPGSRSVGSYSGGAPVRAPYVVGAAPGAQPACQNDSDDDLVGWDR